MTFSWTDENVSKLKGFYEANLSCSRIALEFGNELTRNAVIGKVHRLGLERRGRANVFHGNQKRSAVRKPRVVKPTKFALSFNAATITKIPVASFEVRLAAVQPLHLDLMELTDATCRYPYGDGPFTFCGCATRNEKPYCAAHYELAYRPQEAAGAKAPRQRVSA